MINTVLIWIVCSGIVFAGLIFGRTSVLHRSLRISDLDWKSVVVVSMLVGALAAVFYDQKRSRSVDVPTTLDERGAVPGSRNL